MERSVKQMKTISSRRQFLKTSVSAAGATWLLGLGCDEAPGEFETQANDEIDSAREDINVDYETRDGSLLFSSGRIGQLEIKNRIIRSATEEFYAYMGHPTKRYTEVLTDLAAGGVGLIISGMAGV